MSSLRDITEYILKQRILIYEEAVMKGIQHNHIIAVYPEKLVTYVDNNRKETVTYDGIPIVQIYPEETELKDGKVILKRKYALIDNQEKF